MDTELIALAGSAGSTLVGLAATDAWNGFRNGLLGMWRRARPDRVDAIADELDAAQEELRSAHAADDQVLMSELAAEWGSRIRRLLAAHPDLAEELRGLLERNTDPASTSVVQKVKAYGHAQVHQAGRDLTVREEGNRNDGRASGHGHLYQASGDQYVTEQHYYGHVAGSDQARTGPDSVRHPAVGHGPRVLRDRTEVMQELRAALQERRGGVYVLHGLGGCGKTAVASTLFRFAVEEAGRVGLWVNASDTASLRSGMLAVAADRGASEGELAAARSGIRAAADLVWEKLDTSAQPWLLVLDNADDPTVVRDDGWLRSSERGTVLVTSRQAVAQWWPTARLLHVGVLPLDEAAQVLCDLAPEAGTLAGAQNVAERLGRLPLALTLAGSFLSRQVIQPWTMDEYAEQLNRAESDRITLIDQGAPYGGGSRHLLGRTWQLSIDGLTRRGLPEAVDLLRLLACWAGDPLPVEVLTDAGEALGMRQDRMEAALRGMLDQSLTELTTDGARCLRTHAVLLDSVSASTPPDDRSRYAIAASELVLSRLPEVPQRGRVTPLIARLVPHGTALLWRAVRQARPDPQAVRAATRACLRLVTALHRGGDPASAHTTGRETLDLAAVVLPADDVLLLRLRVRLGRCLHRLGRFQDAVALLRTLLSDAEAAMGPQSLEAMGAALALGRSLEETGESAEAAPLVHGVVEGRARQLGESHPLTLLARSATLESHSTDVLNAALSGADQLVRDCHQEMGQDHAITLMAELNHAYALFTTGRSDLALPQARRTIMAHERRYGADHPMTLASRHLLAQVLAATGSLEEAVRQAERVRDDRIRILGPEHPWTQGAAQLVAEFHDQQ